MPKAKSKARQFMVFEDDGDGYRQCGCGKTYSTMEAAKADASDHLEELIDNCERPVGMIVVEIAAKGKPLGLTWS